MIRFYRDYHLHPLVLLKLAACKLHIAGVVDLIEFCHRCGRRVTVHWWAHPELWYEVIGMGDAGVRCVRCFDVECLELGLSVRWTPVVELRRDVEGRWSEMPPPDPEFFPVAARFHREARP